MDPRSMTMFARKALAALLCSFLLSPAFAASVSERSPFYQGLWWDSTRSGNGFDLFTVGDYVMVIWYTYDSDGRPIWYVAEGSRSAGSLDLVRHGWADGTRAEAARVGSVRLTARSAEVIDFAWTLGSSSGTWTLRPFRESAGVNEIDHSGTWYRHGYGGFGLSFMEQGEVHGSVIYTFDASGAPTWLAGFGRDPGSVELFTHEGACPSCPNRTSTARSVGRLGFDFVSEGEMTLRGDPAFSLAPGIQLNGARIVQLGRPASTRPADNQLASFDDAATLRAHLIAGFGSPGGFSAGPPTPTPTPTFPTTGSSFSTTNLQEAGVDESDLVKTDGQYVYTYAYGGQQRLPAVRIARIGGAGDSLEIAGTYPLVSGDQASALSAGLFLHERNLVSIWTTQSTVYANTWVAGRVQVEAMSTANPSSPATIWRADIDGFLVSSRRIGDRIYLVLGYSPAYPVAQPLASTPLSELLPKFRLNGGAAQPLLDASMVYAPPQGDRPATNRLVVVVAIDLPIAGSQRQMPQISQVLAIAGTPETIYASPGNLYLATIRGSYGVAFPFAPVIATPMTDLHQIQLGSAQMDIVGSAPIDGFFGYDVDKAAFRLSEHGGQLRVVSGSDTWGDNKNRLTILAPSTIRRGFLRTVATLPNAARPERLGKPGELLYATRFVGDRLYAVTFKKIDPLYVVDLSDSTDPKIAGALELPGFSDYLHPMANGLLLGFGKDACPASTTGDGQFAWYQGLQLALFDVSNPNQPRQVQRLSFGQRGSTSALLQHHHAFSAMQRANGTTAIAIPARIHDGNYAGCGPNTYAWKESGLLRFELSAPRCAETSLVQKPNLTPHAAGSSSGDPGYGDPASSGGRSILFENATIYIGNGQFWRQDANGDRFGPY